MSAHETRFKKRVGMVAQNSFGTVAQEDDVEMTFIIRVGDAKEDGSQYGSFEFFDNDVEWYAEGGLWFENGELVDMDGTYSLSRVVADWLIEQGYEVSPVYWGGKKE